MKNTVTKKFYLKNINICKFRGLKNCVLEECKDINLIVGNNNCGKTSVLEAIKLIANNNIAYFINQSNYRNANSTIENFRFMFPVDDNTVSISLDTNEGKINYKVEYNTNEIMFNKEAYLKQNQFNAPFLKNVIEANGIDGKKVIQYYGSLKYNNYNEDFSFISLDLLGAKFQSKKPINLIQFETPTTHFNIPPQHLNSILTDEKNYNIFLKVLQMFDSDITDIKILAINEMGISVPVIYVLSKNKPAMPLSLYGDGIKKVICISYALALSKGGVLLIDEIETSLHHNYFDEIFKYIIKVAKAYNIQIFITTHSKETIDFFIKAEDSLENLKSLNIYTIRNKKDKTYCKKYDGESAKFIRFESDLEVRD